MTDLHYICTDYTCNNVTEATPPACIVSGPSYSAFFALVTLLVAQWGEIVPRNITKKLHSSQEKATKILTTPSSLLSCGDTNVY